MPTPPMKKHFGHAAPDWRERTGNRYPADWTNDQIMWRVYAEEPNTLGKFAGGLFGGIIPDITMALFGSALYGDAYVSAYFNVTPGLAEHNARFDNVRTEPALQYAQSDAAFTNQFRAMGMTA